MQPTDAGNIDFSQLEQHVLSYWEDNAIEAWNYSHYDTNSDYGTMYESHLKDWAEVVLSDPNEIIMALGFESGDYASYVQAYYGEK